MRRQVRSFSRSNWFCRKSLRAMAERVWWGERERERARPRVMAMALMREWSSSMTVEKVSGPDGERVEEVRRKGVSWSSGGRVEEVSFGSSEWEFVIILKMSPDGKC